MERDSMGEMQVPADAYYGASTQRAVLNFPISGQAMPRRFIRALGMVKRAAAQTNRELGLLPRRRTRAIAAAAQEVVDGKLDDQFPIDVYQTGSGTSTNTNANEVIANRATEILGGERGSKLVHPNDHVNLCQSSNDVIPTAIQLAAALAIQEEMIPALERLQPALEGNSREFWPVVKTGRSHLQCSAPRPNATRLWKVGSDIRLMGSGPVAGLGELRLPETQPGSSIMPGKVNPVIVESLLMVIARVYGNDATVVVSGQAGSLFELNVMMPVAGVATLESITLLAAATRNFSERCVEGLQATDRGPELVERSPMLATALNPVIGYDEAAKLAKESMRSGKSIRQLARAKGVSEKQLNKVLDLGKMTKPGLEGPGGGG